LTGESRSLSITFPLQELRNALIWRAGLWEKRFQSRLLVPWDQGSIQSAHPFGANNVRIEDASMKTRAQSEDVCWITGAPIVVSGAR
jgi:hypothetical protein